MQPMPQNSNAITKSSLKVAPSTHRAAQIGSLSRNSNPLKSMTKTEVFRKSASTKLVLRSIDPAKSVATVQPSTDESAPMQRSSRHSEPSKSTAKVEASRRPVRLQQPTASNPQCKYTLLIIFVLS